MGQIKWRAKTQLLRHCARDFARHHDGDGTSESVSRVARAAMSTKAMHVRACAVRRENRLCLKLEFAHPTRPKPRCGQPFFAASDGHARMERGRIGTSLGIDVVKQHDDATLGRDPDAQLGEVCLSTGFDIIEIAEGRSQALSSVICLVGGYKVQVIAMRSIFLADSISQHGQRLAVKQWQFRKARQPALQMAQPQVTVMPRESHRLRRSIEVTHWLTRTGIVDERRFDRRSCQRHDIFAVQFGEYVVMC